MLTEESEKGGAQRRVPPAAPAASVADAPRAALAAPALPKELTNLGDRPSQTL